VSFGGNFALTKPKTEFAEEALNNLDFFMMTELFETPSTRQADLVLPVASAWERSGLQAGFVVDREADQWLQLRPAVVPPRGECRSDTEIVFALAERLGLGDQFFGGDPEAGLRHVLEPTGTSLESLRSNPRGIHVDVKDTVGAARRQGFSTRSGRVELFAAGLAGIDEDPLPHFEYPAMSPEGRPDLADFPLRLTCAKWPQFCHSQQRQQSSILEAMPHPLVQLHPQTAAFRGIENGDQIEITTPSGQFVAHAELTLTIRSDTVCAQYGWWDAVQGLEQPPWSYNGAIDGAIIDKPSGSNTLRSYLCQVALAR
jgi:anaerobic selenocysteine-containing dehydrogenase